MGPAKSLSGLLCLFFATVAAAEETGPVLAQAQAAYQSGDYAAAARLYEAAFSAAPTVPLPAYNAACCHARLSSADEAFAWLEKAIDVGWRDLDQLKGDADLERLQADERWGPAVGRCRAQLVRYQRSLKKPALREELLKRMKEDQRVRMSPNPDFREWTKVDADNTAFMKTVIDKHGWPGKSMVDSDGALAAFLLVQHADADTAFQKRCLELLTKAVEQKEARAEDMAYLTDRVLVAAGKPQRYGTQFHKPHGELIPLPIEDEANVDARRKEVGLPPLTEYARQVREMDRP